MTTEEKRAHLQFLIAAAEEQAEKLRIGLGQARAVLDYLMRELELLDSE